MKNDPRARSTSPYETHAYDYTSNMTAHCFDCGRVMGLADLKVRNSDRFWPTYQCREPEPCATLAAELRAGRELRS